MRLELVLDPRDDECVHIMYDNPARPTRKYLTRTFHAATMHIDTIAHLFGEDTVQALRYSDEHSCYTNMESLLLKD